LNFATTRPICFPSAVEILAAAEDRGEISPGDRDNLYRVAHSLKGMAPNCGYSLAGVVAFKGSRIPLPISRTPAAAMVSAAEPGS
jgi:hypothetical protein